MSGARSLGLLVGFQRIASGRDEPWASGSHCGLSERRVSCMRAHPHPSPSPITKYQEDTYMV